MRKIKKLLLLLFHPKLLIIFIRHGVASTIEHKEIFQTHKFDVVVDIGANKGQFSCMANYFNRNCKIFAFEPLNEPFLKLQNLFKNNTSVKTFKTAIGPSVGDVDIYVSNRMDSSSLLRIGEKQETYFKNTNLKNVEIVKSGNLDMFINKSDLIGNSLLKIDVQGYELEVLKSSSNLIEHFNYIYCECSFEELYENQVLASELINYLFQIGFEVENLINFVYVKNKLIQVDIMFCKRTMN